jgi:hypothetical protein
VRDGNNTLQNPNGGHAHQQGQSWMGFAWKLRERLALTRGRSTAIAVSNDIVLGSIVANAPTQATAVLEVFLADDNDGNLLNGTPHTPELAWACAQHSLPNPAPPGVPNDECTSPFELSNAVNGPFTTTGASTSAPAFLCGFGGNDVWFVYPVGAAGQLDVRTCGHAGWDTVIEVYSGVCGNLSVVACNDDDCNGRQSRLQVAVEPGVHFVRVGGYQGASGTFSLEVAGPIGSLVGVREEFGVACGAATRSFYEEFRYATFDLSHTTMRMTRYGDRYAVGTGGAFVVPTAAATVLPLGDDTELTIALPAPFPFAGGTTSTLAVCSNGFVSTAPSGDETTRPSWQEWYASTGARWGSWHDFDPTAAGGGRVKREDVGSRVIVTWDGVHTWNTASPNTLQLQFDLATGDVTFVWLAVTDVSSLFLVGHVGVGGSALHLGPRDLSADVPAGFATGGGEVLPPTLAGNHARLGETLTLTSTFPTEPTIGLLLLGLQRLDPGVSLDAFGLPGCRQHSSAEAVLVQVPVAGVASHVLPIPPDGRLLGLPLVGQSVAVSPAANATGLAFSRGLALVVGW